jgi:hypothetical protein
VQKIYLKQKHKEADIKDLYSNNNLSSNVVDQNRKNNESKVILNHILVLVENPVLDAKDVDYNAVHRLAEVGKPSMQDYEISIGYNRSLFIHQCWSS